MADEVPETNPFVVLPRHWCAGEFGLDDVEALLRKQSPTIFVDPDKASKDLKALYEPMDLGNLEPLMPKVDTDLVLEMPDEQPITATEAAHAKAQAIIEQTKWLSEVPKGAKIPEQDFGNIEPINW